MIICPGRVHLKSFCSEKVVPKYDFMFYISQKDRFNDTYLFHHCGRYSTSGGACDKRRDEKKDSDEPMEMEVDTPRPSR